MGLKDGSSAIMHEHASRDPRIICIDKANEGYGATCNRGLDMAQGEYIAIVEPDDYLLPVCLPKCSISLTALAIKSM